MIKVLIAVSSLGSGGITGMLRQYVSAVDRERFSIDLLVYSGSDLTNRSFFEENGCKVFLCADPGKHYLTARREIVQLLKKEHYDVLHACNSLNSGFLMQFAAIAGVPQRIVHSHSSHDYVHSFVYRMYGNVMFAMISEYANRRLACSAKAGAYLFRDLPFDVLPNAVPAEKFAYSQEERRRIREQYGIGEDDFLIGTVAMISAVKNQPFILQVLKYLPSRYRFMLVGDGDQREAFEKAVRDEGLGDRVIITGWTNEAWRYYSAFDVFVLPSFSEGFPVVSLEAQAGGLVCLMSDAVTQEADVTSRAQHLPIGEQDAQRWAEAIQAVQCESRENPVAGTVFDIRENIRMLEAYYEGSSGIAVNDRSSHGR